MTIGSADKGAASRIYMQFCLRGFSYMCRMIVAVVVAKYAKGGTAVQKRLLPINEIREFDQKSTKLQLIFVVALEHMFITLFQITKN